MVEPDWAALEDLDDDQLAAALLEYLDAVTAGRSAEAENAAEKGYDSQANRAYLRRRGIWPRIALAYRSGHLSLRLDRRA